MVRIPSFRPAAMPRKPSASRSQIRRIGLLGLLLTTLLTPAGIIVGTVTAAALIGGAFHLNRAAPEAPATPPHPISVETGGLQHPSIERGGDPLVLVMAENEAGYGGGVDSFDPANLLFAGLAGDGPVRHSAPGATSPGTPMPGGGVAPGRGSSPTGGLPSRGPSNPPGETDDPTKPEKIITPPVILDIPPWVDPPPTEGPPEEILPGFDTSPHAGNPLDPQTPAPGKQWLTQPHAVPEPSMFGLMLLGVIAMAWAERRPPGPRRPAWKP